MSDKPTEAQIRKEKEKGKKLRNTQWWQAKLNAGICHYCGDKFKKSELTMDHIVPLSRGGKSTRGNVVVSCKPCNTRKKYHTPAEMILQKNFNKKILF